LRTDRDNPRHAVSGRKSKSRSLRGSLHPLNKMSRAFPPTFAFDCPEPDQTIFARTSTRQSLFNKSFSERQNPPSSFLKNFFIRLLTYSIFKP
jgi:hypothetical protein